MKISNVDKNYPALDVKKAFYFIPDISGFSSFVENTAIEHSIHIISELLEILLDNNVLEMELAEIEGDALFMYTSKNLEFQDIESQVANMLNAFRGHLRKYEHQRICNCGACSSAINLKLKFILHFGRLDFIQVKEIKKPYGQDVNRIHRLLKNDVPLAEYLLLSHLALEAFSLQKEEIEMKELESNYDIQIFPYYYKNLNSYKKTISKDIPKSKIGIDKKANIIVEREMEAPLDKIYDLLSDFNHRKKWDKALTEIEFEKAKVNKVGTKHNCIIGNRKMTFETTENPNVEADQVYAEKTQDLPMASSYHYYILLDKVNENRTQVKVLNYVELNWFGRLFKKRFYNRIQNKWNKKLKDLERLSRENY